MTILPNNNLPPGVTSKDIDGCGFCEWCGCEIAPDKDLCRKCEREQNSDEERRTNNDND